MNREFSVVCPWCEREVVSFIDPPAMVTIGWKIDHDLHSSSLDRICLSCFTDLIKFIAEQKVRSAA